MARFTGVNPDKTLDVSKATGVMEIVGVRLKAESYTSSIIVTLTPADAIAAAHALLEAAGTSMVLEVERAAAEAQRAAQEREEGIEALRLLIYPPSEFAPGAGRTPATRAYDAGLRAPKEN